MWSVGEGTNYAGAGARLVRERANRKVGWARANKVLGPNYSDRFQCQYTIFREFTFVLSEVMNY
jgi:hypothetical protein